MNAVLVKSDAVGPTLYYGAGAGAEPTASAVVADIVDVGGEITESGIPNQLHSYTTISRGEGTGRAD